MRVALVTTPATTPSRIGDSTRALAPHLAEHCEVTLFVGGTGKLDDGERSAFALNPRDHDHIVYCLGNEPAHAFMPDMIRSFGGTVWLHDWVLLHMALHAFPALEDGGIRGHYYAWREGGASQMRAWRRQRHLMSRERARAAFGPGEDAAELALNHSVVRFADGFLVRSQEIKQRILVERNARTPVAVLQHAPGANAAPVECDLDALARECFEYLEQMPRPRSGQRTSLAARVKRELELRRQQEDARQR